MMSKSISTRFLARAFLGLSIFLYAGGSSSFADGTAPSTCNTVKDCAQAAVKAANTALQAEAHMSTLIGRNSAAIKSASVAISNSREFAVPGGFVGRTQHTHVANCPRGEVLTGLRLELGGTCDNKCDPDGEPVSGLKIICSVVRLQKTFVPPKQ